MLAKKEFQELCNTKTYIMHVQCTFYVHFWYIRFSWTIYTWINCKNLSINLQLIFLDLFQIAAHS